MKIITETSIGDFEFWGGAITTFNRIEEEGKIEELEQLLEDQYPNGIEDTTLNDLLWFEEDWLYSTLGIEEEEEEEEEE